LGWGFAKCGYDIGEVQYKKLPYLRENGSNSLGEEDPPNKPASCAILASTRRTISPRYIPPNIFSNHCTAHPHLSQFY